MPSTASDSCHMTSGCSGLPKLRQLTTAMGRAPAQATLRAPSATVAAVPARGSIEHQVGLESVVRASPLRRRRQAGGGQPEHGGVPARAVHRVEEELVVVLAVDPRRVRQHGQDVGPAVVGRGQRPGVVGRPGLVVAGLGQRPVVERGVLAEGDGRDVAQHLAVEAVEDAQAARARRRAAR